MFAVPEPYIPGSLRVFLNGLVLRSDFTDGFTESGTTQFTMNEPPQAGDVLYVYYLPVV